jgi:hypothetical protein
MGLLLCQGRKVVEQAALCRRMGAWRQLQAWLVPEPWRGCSPISAPLLSSSLLPLSASVLRPWGSPAGGPLLPCWQCCVHRCDVNQAVTYRWHTPCTHKCVWGAPAPTSWLRHLGACGVIMRPQGLGFSGFRLFSFYLLI